MHFSVRWDVELSAFKFEAQVLGCSFNANVVRRFENRKKLRTCDLLSTMKRNQQGILVRQCEEPIIREFSGKFVAKLVLVSIRENAGPRI